METWICSMPNFILLWHFVLSYCVLVITPHVKIWLCFSHHVAPVNRNGKCHNLPSTLGITSHLGRGICAVKITIFDFSTIFNTRQSPLLTDTLLQMRVDSQWESLITDYITMMPLFVRLKNCISVVGSKGLYFLRS